ncbi:MAG: hypothetical protein QM811_29690 [Pirellulales bacterium]
MATLFFVCAIVGGTITVCQFFLTLFGMGDHDLAHGGGGDFDAGHLGHGGHTGDTSDSTDLHDTDHHDADHGTSWIFGVLTFRTLVTFVAFFGLAGMAGTTADWPDTRTLLVAIAVGAAAVYVVQLILRGISRLRADGTVRIQHAVGQPGTVYLRIPAVGNGYGKVTLTLQNRSVELEAATAGDQPLAGGTPIVVTRVLGPDRVEVAAAV